jgi:hypothetical protein
MEITEAIPIIIPSIVSPDLALLAERAEYVSCNKSEFFIIV